VHDEQLATLPARIALARAYNAQARGDLAASVRQAARALDLAAAEAGGRLGSVIEILLLQSLAHATQGETARALAGLQRAKPGGAGGLCPAVHRRGPTAGKAAGNAQRTA
jgi:hypothetical protein